MTASTPPPHSDIAEIRRTLALLHGDGTVVELRIPDAGRAATVSGYYNDHDKLAQDAARLNRQYGTTFVTLNPPHPALLARAVNRFREHAKFATADHHITRRR